MAKAAAFMAGEVTAAKFCRRSELLPQEEELRSTAINALVREDIISGDQNPDTGEFVFVIDPTKINGISRDKLLKYVGGIGYDGSGNQLKKSEIIARIFRDIQSITPGQQEEGDLNPKPFLYIPKNAKDALDPAKIKKAEFQTTLWDIAGNKEDGNEEYPVADGPGANALETRLATIIFHPSYGDGYRDKSGVLLVRDPATREYKKFSTGTLSDYNISGTRLSVRGGKVVRSSRQGLAEMAPSLIRNGALRKEDLMAIRGTKTGVYDRRPSKRGIKKLVMFNGVRHYVGPHAEGAAAVLLSPTTAGIIEKDASGKEMLTRVFNAFDSSQFELKQKEKFHDSGVDETKPRPFDLAEFSGPKKDGESEELYANRRAVVDYVEFMKIKDDLAKIGIPVDSGNIETETNLARAVRILSQTNRYEIFLAFAKKTGESGIAAIITAGDDAPYVEAILKIGEKLSADKAREFFEETDQEKILESLHENSGDKTIVALRENIRRTNRELFIRCAASETAIKNPRETKKILDRAKAEIRLFENMLRIIEETEQLPSEYLRGTEMAITETGELSDLDLANMLKQFEETRKNDLDEKGKPIYDAEHLEGLVQDFKQKLENPKARFYTVRQGGAIIAFVRFEDLPNDHVYAGSFTTSKDLRGEKLGSALMRTAFAQENADRTLEAIVFSGNPRLMEYHTQKLGHEIHYDQPLKIGGALYYRMTREPRKQATVSLGAAA